jgi:hypothetical protein
MTGSGPCPSTRESVKYQADVGYGRGEAVGKDRVSRLGVPAWARLDDSRLPAVFRLLYF